MSATTHDAAAPGTIGAAGISPATLRTERPRRIRGIDLARGLAMFGMFAAHVGPAQDVGGVAGGLMFVASGRSSILFATLAGVSLALLSGGAHPQSVSDRQRSVRRIAVRGALVLALGTALTALGTPVSVILAYYGVLFLLAIPFLSLRPRTLVIIAGGWAVIGPVLTALLQSWWWDSPASTAFSSWDPIALVSGEGVDQLLFAGAYPALTWMPFILAGLALGRMDVARMSRRILVTVGAGLSVGAYGLAGILVRVAPTSAPGVEDTAGFGFSPWSTLLGAEAHTGSPLEIVGGIGVAVCILAVSLWIAERFPRLSQPVVAVGSMSLTVYSLHVLAINVSGLDAMPGQPLWVLLAFIAGAVVFAAVWSRIARRGPLESLVHVVTKRVADRRSS